ncbi:hypothetical protein CAPTEDRAFT_191836 [Capitella teleta]|uniref:Uncharacterized protein n=1 Tax=Capitella teleta TaxID=283909 RepID=R7TXZ9_CAPTE|nr:hypothetical protein CAPTEDRAFT_191836 [Capitella teleta]|eukprot:ELT98788.1 hypothetical protein CAPTEDRAFT_191836 [Capitella teleta]
MVGIKIEFVVQEPPKATRKPSAMITSGASTTSNQLCNENTIFVEPGTTIDMTLCYDVGDMGVFKPRNPNPTPWTPITISEYLMVSTFHILEITNFDNTVAFVGEGS